TEAIVIGATASLTGNSAAVGQYVQQSYELAFDMANEQGGLTVAGTQYPLELVLLDDASDPATAVSLAERLASQEDVDFMLGTYGTSLVNPQSTVAEQNQIP